MGRWALIVAIVLTVLLALILTVTGLISWLLTREARATMVPSFCLLAESWVVPHTCNRRLCTMTNSYCYTQYWTCYQACYAYHYTYQGLPGRYEGVQRGEWSNQREEVAAKAWLATYAPLGKNQSCWVSHGGMLLEAPRAIWGVLLMALGGSLWGLSCLSLTWVNLRFRA